MALKYDKERDLLTGNIPARAPFSGFELEPEGNGKLHRFEGRSREYVLSVIGALQVAVYVMCGGGMLGRFAAEQPAEFYIDMRVGKLPYPKKDILQAVTFLDAISTSAGFDTSGFGKDGKLKMPAMPDLPGCWVW